jgi:hypothetical protein
MSEEVQFFVYGKQWKFNLTFIYVDCAKALSTIECDAYHLAPSIDATASFDESNPKQKQKQTI